MAADVSIPPTPAADPVRDVTRQKRGALALRLELEAERDGARSALLSHELGRIHELNEDLAALARDTLAATNHASLFLEPLETLIRVAQSRKSRANLEKLLDRLLKVSPTPELRLRAGLELWAHLLENGELQGAEELLCSLREESPEDPSLWLAAQLLAARRGDPDAQFIALLGRAERAQDPDYRAELLERAAEHAIERDQEEESFSLLERALDARLSWQRLRLLSHFAESRGRFDAAVAAQQRLRALTESSSLDTTRVPTVELTREARRFAKLHEALLWSRSGQSEPAHVLTSELRDELPEDWFARALVDVLLEQLEIPRELWLEKKRALLDELLETAPPEERGGLQLLAALVSQELNDEPPSRAHLAAAIEELPQSAILRALELERVTSDDEKRSAQILTAWGETSPAETRATLLLAAALLVARTDPAQAIRWLETSREAGVDPRLVRRLLRVVASLSSASDLVLASDLSLVEDEAAHPSLVWEGARLAFLGHKTNALERLLPQLDSHSWGRILLEALLVQTEDAEGRSAPHWPDALPRVLREAQLSETAHSALSLIQASRELRENTATSRSVGLSRLLHLVERDPTDPLVLSALLATVERDQPDQAVRFRIGLAQRLENPKLAAAWTLQSLLAALRRGDTADAWSALEKLEAWPESELGGAALHALRALGKVAQEKRDQRRRDALSAGDAEVALELACEQLSREPLAALQILSELFERAATDETARRSLEARRTAFSWLTLLLGAGTSTEELKSLLPRLTPELIEENESALLELARALRGDDPERQAELAAQFLTTTRSSLPEDRGALLDAALTALVLAQRADAPELIRTAELTLGEVLADPLLTAQAELRARHGLSREEGEDLARALEKLSSEHPHASELIWIALEARRGRPNVERDLLLERLRATLQESDPDDPDVLTADLLLGFDHLSRGENEDAQTIFARLFERFPHDAAVLQGVRISAERLERPELEVEALQSLAQKLEDDTRSADLWERAGDLYRDHLGALERAEFCYCAALERDPRRASSFARVYRLVRARQDRPRLIELIDARLEIVDAVQSRIELLWEKARLCHALERRPLLRRVLSSLLEQKPDHLPALALSAEALLADEQHQLAAETLSAIARHPETPIEERTRAGFSASDRFEKLHRPDRSVALLDDLEPLGVPRLELLERRARTAALAEIWNTAFRDFHELNQTTDSPAVRLHSAQMMLAIQRDHVGSRAALEEAAELVLREAPTDPDAVVILVESARKAQEKAGWLERPIQEAIELLQQSPLHLGTLNHLVEWSRAADQQERYRVALGITDLISSPNETRRAQLERWVSGKEAPRGAFTGAELERIASPRELGAPGRVAALLAPHVAALTAPSLEALGVNPVMRVDPFSTHPARAAISAWTELLGIEDFELYLGGHDAQGLLGFDKEFPTLIIGNAVSFPLSAKDRARLASTLYAFSRGLSVFLSLPLAEARLWIDAAQLAQTPPLAEGSTQDPELEKRATALRERLPHETREELRALLSEVSPEALRALPIALRTSAAKLASLVHGDPSILRNLPRLIPEIPEERRELLSELIAFAVTDEFSTLRRKAGLEST